MPQPPRLSSLLTAHSFFSEGAGVASPRRLARLAAERGFRALGLTDDASVSGAVELGQAGRAAGLQTVVGATLPVLFPAEGRRVQDSGEVFPLVLLAANRGGYRALNELLSLLGLEGQPSVPLSVVLAHAEDLFCLTGPRRGFATQLFAQRRLAEAMNHLRQLHAAFRSRLFVQLYHEGAPADRRRMTSLRALARDQGLPTVAAPEVRLALAAEYPLLDALGCARLGIDVTTPHPRRPRNDAAHLHTPEDWARLIPYPDALANADRLARECALDLLPERLTPPEPRLPPRVSAQQHLEERAFGALTERFSGPALLPADLRLREELATVRALDLAGFFLTAAEITDHCRDHGILAAGRGSAAGSVLCYLLGITLADPIRHGLLFERFLHTGRSVMPDIDIDIASARRDEVIRWVEERWGHDTQAMVANRISYRLPSALQDLGRALGLPAELRNRLTRALGRDHRGLRPHRAREAEGVFGEVLGDAPVKEALLSLLERMEPGFVRHLAPHSGGVVLSKFPLTHHSPLSRSAGGLKMLAFDKDDVEALGLIKLDLLGLRMLSVLERSREEVARLTGEWTSFTDLPDDPAVWARIGVGDTMGLFQIESPAQVRMSADLKPRSMTDLAHQIALIRPGPIQSGSVHPYVRRRLGLEPLPEQREPVKSILAATYGTLLFQEQILRLAVHYCGLDWTQADRFRSRLSKVEDPEELAELRALFLEGAARTGGAAPEEASAVFAMCAAFKGYGFAESHAWAFAGHAYASAWLRQYYPGPYLAAVLTEHPGMWPRSVIADEAARHGVRLAGVDLNRSGVQYRAAGRDWVRVPLTAVEGMSEHTAQQIVLDRLAHGKYESLDDAYDRLPLHREVWEALVKAGALDGITAGRRPAFYRLLERLNAGPPGQRALLVPADTLPELPPLSAAASLELDLALTGVTGSGLHPLDLRRAALRDLGCAPLGQLRPGQHVRTAGLIVARQKPPTARGFAFYVISDRASRAQVIISPALWEVHRQLLRDASALVVDGEVQGAAQALAIRAEHLAELPLGAKRVEGYAFR